MMRSTSPPAAHLGLSRRDTRGPTLLDELLCIDGVTDLAVYRILRGRAGELVDVPAPPREQPNVVGQTGILVLVRGEAE